MSQTAMSSTTDDSWPEKWIKANRFRLHYIPSPALQWRLVPFLSSGAGFMNTVIMYANGKQPTAEPVGPSDKALGW